MTIERRVLKIQSRREHKLERLEVQSKLQAKKTPLKVILKHLSRLSKIGSLSREVRKKQSDNKGRPSKMTVYLLPLLPKSKSKTSQILLPQHRHHHLTLPPKLTLNSTNKKTSLLTTWIACNNREKLNDWIISFGLSYLYLSFSLVHLDDQLVTTLPATILTYNQIKVFFCLSRQEEPTDLGAALREFETLEQLAFLVEEG